MKTPYAILSGLLLFAPVAVSAAGDSVAPVAAPVETGNAFGITPSQAMAVGRMIWKNECKGTISGLTSWNVGEGFPSLGIGHFIWYVKGREERFQESFPGLVAHLRARGAAVPEWLLTTTTCPWKNKREFDQARNSTEMRELRQLMASTISLQAEYIAKRMAAALPTMLTVVPEAEREAIRARFKALFATPAGLYALMDYANFKGEGVNPAERYEGQGWGMLQVLQGMPGLPTGAEAVKAFSESAAAVLERRVNNAPAERKPTENRFLDGWKKRCRSYATLAGF